MKNYYKYQNEQFYCYDENANHVVTYQGLESLFYYNELWDVERGLFHVPYSDFCPGGLLKLQIVDYQYNVISTDIILGWFRDYVKSRYIAYAIKSQVRVYKRKHGKGKHSKGWQYRRISHFNERRHAAIVENLQYVKARRNVNNLPQPWDDYYYSNENNWKSNKKRKHQYKQKELS